MSPSSTSPRGAQSAPRSRISRSRPLSALGILLAVALVAVLAGWPLAVAPGRWFPSDPSMPDLNASMWLPAHLLAAVRGETGLWQATELQWPLGQRIDLLVWNLGAQLLQLPLYAVAEPVAAYNLSLVLFAVLNGLAGYLLGRRIGGPAGGGAAAAVLLTSPYLWNELVQGRVEQGLLAGVALTAWALLGLREVPSTRRAVGAGLLWAATGLCYWFHAYFLLLLVAALAALALVRRRRAELRALVLAGATAALAAGPFAAALVLRAAGADSVYSQSVSDEVTAWAQVMQRGASLGLEGFLWPVGAGPEQLRDYLPLSALAVVAAALVGPVRRRTAFLLPLALVGLVLATGRVLQWSPGEPVLIGGLQLTMPFAALQDLLPGFARLWWPYRWLSFFYVGAAGCAAALVAALPRSGRVLLAGVLAGALLGELRLAQDRARGGLVWDDPTPAAVPAVFREIAAGPPAPVVMLPYLGVTGNRVLWQAYLQQPTSAGLGDREAHLRSPEHRAYVEQTPILRSLAELGNQPPVGGHRPVAGLEQGGAALHDLGFRYAVLWRDLFSADRYEAWLGPPDFQDGTVAVWRLDAGPSGPVEAP